MKSTEFVTIAILAKEKAHVLPLYLDLIENQTYPASQIKLYIRTNNNRDHTAAVLEQWIEKVRDRYSEIHYDCSDVEEPVHEYSPHEWNALRFQVLARIRQDSVEWAKARGTHYFVVDCDNFIVPETLETLLNTGLPVVGPLLRNGDDPLSHYSNFHYLTDENGYYRHSPLYFDVLYQTVKGLIQVEVIHCTYLVRKEALDGVIYNDGSGRYEYVIFSDMLRKHGIPQYIDNRRCYGKITFCNTEEEFKVKEENILTDIPSKSKATPAQVVFSQIYNKNLWGNGSGWGSHELHTKGYRDFLHKFLAEKSIKSVVDLGCGDWQIARHMNWDGIQYLGIDVVGSVIEENRKNFSSGNIEFQCIDVVGEKQLPKADLIIIKDVLQHWPIKEIIEFLPKISSYKYALITNCILGNNLNGDIDFGGFRPLDLHDTPFNCNCERVFSFPDKADQANWEKVVYLFQPDCSDSSCLQT